MVRFKPWTIADVVNKRVKNNKMSEITQTGDPPDRGKITWEETTENNSDNKMNMEVEMESGAEEREKNQGKTGDTTDKNNT